MAKTWWSITVENSSDGPQATSPTWWRKSAAVEQAMADAYEAGVGLDEVAAQFGYSRRLVKRAVIEHGGTIRQKGPIPRSGQQAGC